MITVQHERREGKAVPAAILATVLVVVVAWAALLVWAGSRVVTTVLH